MSLSTDAERNQPSIEVSADEKQESARALFGLNIFFASTTVIFLATIAGYLAVRLTAAEWQSTAIRAESPRFLLSTALLILVSLVLDVGFRQSKKQLSQGKNDKQLLVYLGASLVILSLFLYAQLTLWGAVKLSFPSSDSGSKMAAFAFAMLAGLHAAHILGGYPAILYCAFRKLKAQPATSRLLGLRMTTYYFHFLGAIWLLLLAAIYLIG